MRQSAPNIFALASHLCFSLRPCTSVVKPVFVRLTSRTSIRFPLLRWRAALFLLGLLAPSLFLAVDTARIAVASMLAESGDTSKLETALALDPAIPEIHHQLGNIRSDSPEDFNAEEGLKHLRQAAELSPYKALYWADLASACSIAGERACADDGFEHALRLSPMMPRFRWLAANYYLRTGRSTIALASFQRLLELSPNYARPTYDLCLRVLGNPQAIFERVLAGTRRPELTLDYADFLCLHGNADCAYQVWNETARCGQTFPFSSAKPYLERLLALGRGEEAVTVWQDLQRLGIVVSATPEDRANLVFNGSFEQTPLNAGFDWRYQEAPNPSVNFSETGAYRGAHCLRLDFTLQRNEDYEPVYQIVSVMPDHTYTLAAYVRSEKITSDSGPRLRVSWDAGSGLSSVTSRCRTTVTTFLTPMDEGHWGKAGGDCLDVATEGTVGTTPWHPISLAFQTGPRTRFARLSIWRPRSRAFPPEITGTFWVDAISLKREELSPQRRRNSEEILSASDE